MSYTSRLLAMSTRAAVPTRQIALPIAEEAIVEDVPQPAPSDAPGSASPAPPAAPPAMVAPSPAPRPTPASQVRAPEPVVNPRPPATSDAQARGEVPVAARTADNAPPQVPVRTQPAVPGLLAPPAAERLGTAPALPGWLADEPAAPDPLESLAQSDDARELMRTIRRWTSAPDPTPLAAPVAPATPAAPAVALPETPTSEPVQLSIGNVVITVEDTAPASRHTTPIAPPGPATGNSRLARHYFRGR